MSQATTSAPSVAEVARIVALDNRVIRNLEITECYSRLSQAMQTRTGAAANWCTFATWASRQAGSTIRGEDLLSRLERHLGHKASWLAPLQTLYRMLLRKGLFEPDTKLGKAVSEIHTPFDAFEAASEAVARGNLKVFEEIGREFARFMATVPADAKHDSEEFRAFAAAFRPGPPPEGQDYLKEAFAYYQQQRHEADPTIRAAGILLANLKIGLHEQTRLQPQIAAAVDAPLTTVVDLGGRVLRILFPRSREWSQMRQRTAVSVIDWLAAKLQTVAGKITREVVTEAMMVLALPNVVLSLGRNLEAPVPPVFSGTLPQQLEGFVREYDPCAPGASDCGAKDWCNLRQRMHYILHLFRAYAEENTLFSRPFTDEQVARFRAGIVPDGEI
ncbi:hypothetical protein KJ068_30175 [bacterium]|nr:hypothetical protein [bacterium]